MYLYVYRGYTGGRALSESLVRKSYLQYAAEERAAAYCLAECPEICRTDRGKPYFPDLDIEFSVSHTGNLWVCLMGTVTVGVDVQQIRTNRWEKIAARYYTGDEQEAVRIYGKDSFYQIWTRKEALAKYTGKGLNSGLKTFSTLKKQDVEFSEPNLAPETKCSCCMKEKEEIWIRNLE